jgi:peptide/nickel transport system permease protein
MPTTLLEKRKRAERKTVEFPPGLPRGLPAPPERRSERPGLAARILRQRPAVYAAVLVVLVAFLSILAPLFSPYGRDAMDLDRILAPPSPGYVLGTDELGRDLFTRILYGGRVTLLVAFASVAIATVLGLVLGSAAGYFGGFWERFVTGTVDLFMSIPVFLVLLALLSLGGRGIWFIPLVIGATSWMETARISRARLLSLKRSEFVDAARSLGQRDTALIARHMMPHAFPHIIAAATVGFAHAMLVESALSFLGFGIQPPVPTWGNMLQNAQILLRTSPLVAVAPGLMIFFMCISFNYMGEGLRKALAETTRSC